MLKAPCGDCDCTGRNPLEQYFYYVLFVPHTCAEMRMHEHVFGSINILLLVYHGCKQCNKIKNENWMRRVFRHSLASTSAFQFSRDCLKLDCKFSRCPEMWNQLKRDIGGSISGLSFNNWEYKGNFREHKIKYSNTVLHAGRLSYTPTMKCRNVN